MDITFLSSGLRLYSANPNYQEKQVTISLTAGTHDIRVEYFEHGGTARVDLDYEISGQSRQQLITGPNDGATAGILAYDLNDNGQLLTSADGSEYAAESFTDNTLSDVNLLASQYGYESVLFALSEEDSTFFFLNGGDRGDGISSLSQVLANIDLAAAGLSNPTAIAVSDDARKDIYILGDGKLGRLNLRQNNFAYLLEDGVDGVQGLTGASAITIGESGIEGVEFVYVTSGTNSSIAIFQRNTSTGELTFQQILTGLSGLYDASAIATNPTTGKVYVASSSGFGVADGGIASFDIVIADSGDLIPDQLDITFNNINQLAVNTGANNDIIRQLNSSSANQLTIDGGADVGDVIDLDNVSGEVTIRTGTGNDSISVRNSSVTSLDIFDNGGSNQIEVTDTEATLRAVIDTGSGDDFITIIENGSKTINNLSLSTNEGKDRVEAFNLNLGRESAIFTGADADIVSLSDVEGLDELNTDTGEDIVNLSGVNYGVNASDTVNGFNVTDVKTGRDADQVTINSGNIVNDLDITTNAGDDRINLQSAGADDEIIVYSGNDDDTFEVIGTAIDANATITLIGNGHNGGDTLNFNAGNQAINPSQPTTGSGTIQAGSNGVINYETIESIPGNFTSTVVDIVSVTDINEGEDLSVTVAATPATNTTIDTATLIISRNGRSEEIAVNSITTTGTNISITWDTLSSLRFADDGTYTITLEVTDSAGTTVTTNSNFTITNVNPSDVTIVTTGDLTEGNEVTFTGSFNDAGSSDTHSYTWDFGDGTVVDSDSLEIAHTYADNGNYTVTFTVTDDDGGTSSNSLDLTISNVAPSIDQVIISNSNPQQGEEITLSVNASDPGVNDSLSYSWDFGDGTTATGQEVTYTYNQEGTFTVQVTVTDSDGDSSLAYTQDITVVNAAPTLTDVTIPATGEEGEALTFSATATDINNTNLTYSWDFGDGTTATGATATHIYSQDSLNQVNGVYVVTLTVTDNQGKTTVTSQNIEISNANPTVTAISIPNSAIKGESVSLSATATDVDADNLTYSWDFGDGNTATGANVTHTYNDLDLYSVKLTVKDEDGGIISNNSSILITNLAPTINSDNDSITVNEGENAENTGTFSDSASDTVTLSANIGAVIDKGDGTWTWNYTTDGTTQTQQITITATDSDGEKSTVNFDVTVNNLNPTLGVDNTLITIDEGENASNTGSFADAADDVTLTASVGSVIDNGDGTWTWDYVSSGTLTYEDGTLTGDYDLIDGVDDSQTVTITATDSDGAQTTQTFELVVNNIAPTVTTDNATITVDEGKTAFNTGSFSNDAVVTETTVEGTIESEAVSVSNQGIITLSTLVDVVSLSASVGEVSENGSQWLWTYDVSDEYLTLNPDQTVTITATDSNGDSEEIASFTLETVSTDINLSLSTSVGEVIDNGDFTWSWTYDAPVGFDENEIVTISKNNAEIASFTLGEVINPVVAVDDVTLTASVGEVEDNGDGTWTWFYNTINGPDENQTVTITATDSDGLAQATTFDLVVNAVVSQVLVNQSLVSVDEGDIATNSGTFEDLNADSIVEVTASVGTITDNGDGTWNWSYNTAEVVNGTQTVTITATDNDGLSSSNSFALTVNNVAPEITVTNFYVPINEGETATNDITVTDAGNDAVTVALDPNSLGTISQNGDGIWKWSYQASDDFDDNQTVTIIATDNEDAQTIVSFDLVVDNVAPTTSITGVDTVDEGSEYTLTLNEIIDPGTDTANYLVSWGDSSDVETYTSAGNITHTYVDNGEYTIQVSLDDEDGIYSNAATLSVTVNNIAPTITNFNLSTPISEGEDWNFSAAAEDVGINDNLTYRWDFGDGNQVFGATGTYQYADDGDYTVTLTVEDGDGGITKQSQQITVSNVAPTISLSGADNVDEGSEYTLTLVSVSDPGEDTVTEYTVNWGDGSSDTVTNLGEVTHIYAADGDYTITVDLTDEDDTHLAAGTLPLIVNNVSPTANDDTVITDEDIPINIAVLDNDTDPANDPLTVTEVTNPSNGSVTINPDGTVTYTPDANFFGEDSFGYTITDGQFTDTATVNITVNFVNDAPVAVADSNNTTENSIVTTDVIANDTDVDTTDILSLVADSVVEVKI